MAKQAKEAMQATRLEAIADRGYFHGEEVWACAEAGIVPLVSKPMTSSAKAEGRFDKEDFVFDSVAGEYVCPAGSRLIWRFSAMERGALIHKYWSSDCPRCALKAQCTPSSYRRVTRGEHEDVLEWLQRFPALLADDTSLHAHQMGRDVRGIKQVLLAALSPDSKASCY